MFKVLNIICNDNLNDCESISLDCGPQFNANVTGLMDGFDNGIFKGAHINGRCHNREWYTPMIPPIDSQTITCDGSIGVDHCYLYCLKTDVCAKFDILFPLLFFFCFFFVFFCFFWRDKNNEIQKKKKKNWKKSTTFECFDTNNCYVTADKQNYTAPNLNVTYKKTNQTIIHCVTDYACTNIR